MDSNPLFFDHSTSRDNMFFLGNNSTLFSGPRRMISMEENPARKRLFFSSSDEFIYDDDYYDEQLPEKKRRLTPGQVDMLEKSFEEENKLEPERKTELAKRLGLQPRQVAVWFQNRRARSKTKQLEKDYDILKASYDALLLNYESLLNENDKLKSQVNSLSEKLQVEEDNGPNAPTSGPFNELPLDGPTKKAQQHNYTSEDRVSSGSSSGVDSDGVHHHLVVDSTGDSCFHSLPLPAPSSPLLCIATVHSEEDDVCDDCRGGYFSSTFAVVAEDEAAHDFSWGAWAWAWA